jgi:hypothetical protein
MLFDSAVAIVAPEIATVPVISHSPAVPGVQVATTPSAPGAFAAAPTWTVAVVSRYGSLPGIATPGAGW